VIDVKTQHYFSEIGGHVIQNRRGYGEPRYSLLGDGHRCIRHQATSLRDIQRSMMKNVIAAAVDFAQMSEDGLDVLPVSFLYQACFKHSLKAVSGLIDSNPRQEHSCCFNAHLCVKSKNQVGRHFHLREHVYESPQRSMVFADPRAAFFCVSGAWSEEAFSGHE
jgi:hypothetical protein